MRSKRLITVLLVCLLLGGFALGCAVKATSKPAAQFASVSSLDNLRADLERLFSDANFSNAFWGVEIVSLDRGDLIFERNSTRLFMPASNNKVLTAASALVRLGPEYRFQTKICTDGNLFDGVLKGNLIIVGAGDPSIAPRFFSGDAFAVFKQWARQLKEKGIRRIDGDILGDNRAFGTQPLGYGWEYDDLAYGYAAPITALQFNENLLTLEIQPGPKPGNPASVKVVPLADYVSVDAEVITVASGTDPDVQCEWVGTGESIRVTGSVPSRSKPVLQTVSVRNPALYYLTALKHVLLSEGIDVGKSALRAADDSSAPPGGAMLVLWTHASPPLSDILKPLLKVSQNLYTETLARTLGLAFNQEGSFAHGKPIVEDTLRLMGIEKGTYSYADGSGLSRHNLISPDLLIRIYKYLYRHQYFEHFFAALPIAGVDGTMENRMKGTKAENNVRAKTGSIAKVRALSGYVRTADGEMFAFAMLANNFLVSNKATEYVQDSALERLANFSRK